jgi:SNF family Na+-dependent transporter
VIISYFIIYLIIAKGIKVSGKVAIFTVLGPYVLFLLLFIRIIFLPGSFSGMKYMLTPNFSKLFEFSVWQDALSQTFFQNNIGYGVILSFASFRSKRDPIQSTSYILVFANFASSLLSTLIVFGYMGYFSEISGIPIDKLPLSGPSLIFVTYPASLAMMPFPRIWIFIFFLTMVLLTIDSQIGLLECIAYFIIDYRDRFNKSKTEYLSLILINH